MGVIAKPPAAWRTNLSSTAPSNTPGIDYDIAGIRETRVHPKYTDVNHTLKFGRQKVARAFLFLGVACIAVSILLISTNTVRGSERYIPYFMFGLGVLLAGYGLHHNFNAGTPVAVLSPTGIALNIEWVKNFLVPWHEVKAVERIDVRVPTKGWYTTYKGVTAVVISKKFYERYVHVDNMLLRGPGWEHNFIDNGDTVQIALNYAVLPASADEIYAAVDTRWKAFRDKTKPKAKTS